MDFVRFLVELLLATGVDAPEVDYPKLKTLSGCPAYLRNRSVPDAS
jgi:hypothetical protein